MATHTLATSANLTCVAYSPSIGVLLPADLATICNSIKSDNAVQRVLISHFTRERGLIIPGRGLDPLIPNVGDVIAVDANGWPILVSAYSIATGGWTFT